MSPDSSSICQAGDSISFDPDLYTRDELRRFGLVIMQPRYGYRFTLDPLLLCDFAAASREQSVADLGAGSGVMTLILARIAGEARVVAFEQDQETARLAQQNVLLNGLGERVSILNEDILNFRNCLPVSSCDLVVSNPPYRKQGSGRLNPHQGRLSARHETTAGLKDFLAAAKYLVKPTGRICMVYHPDRLSDLMVEAFALKLAVLRLRLVHGIPDADAKLFLVELAKGRKNSVVQIMPPLIVRIDGEQYTDEVRKILNG